MSEFVKQLLIVCPLLFLAGMCDAIAGGGGTISLPASAIFLALNRNFGAEGREKHFSPVKTALLSFLCGGGVGVYDGFFGPGAGTFYIMALSAVLGLGLTEATADTRVINMASNLGALVTFIAHGVVLWKLAIPGIACTMAGNYVGSSLAIKNGSKFVRPVMAAMIVLLFIKTIYDLVS